jgi:RND family efflux transporter MFP subunit
VNQRYKKAAIPIVIIAAGLGAYQLLADLKPDPPKSDEARRAIGVFVEPVRYASVDTSVTTQGEVRAKTQVEIISQVSGRVTSVSSEFIEGGKVESGVPLVSIEQSDYYAAVSAAEARQASAEVLVLQANADADVARYQLRNETNASDLALKKPQVSQAQANVRAATADLTRARLNLARTQISLPFNGRIVDTAVALGQYVTPGRLIGRAFADDIVEIRLPLNDAQIATLNLPIGFIADADNARLVSITSTLANHQHRWLGSLRRLDAAVDPSTRMLFGTAQVLNPYGQGASKTGMPLAVGLFVSAKIAGPTLENVPVISRAALRAGNLVYVLGKEKTLEIRSVEIAYSSDTEVVIGAGLEVGELVIHSSIRNATEGMPLEIIQQDKSSIQSEDPTNTLGA